MVFKNFIKKILILFSLIITTSSTPVSVFAESRSGLSMSPLNQIIALIPGEEYDGSFTIKNAYGNEYELSYTIGVKPFYVNDNYDIYYEDTENYNQLVDWISVDIAEGTLPVNGEQKIRFTVKVPENAPAGGQYAAIIVTSKSSGNSDSDGIGVTINQNIAMAHILYAEIAGNSTRQGEIEDINTQGFLLNGNIAGVSSIKNTGNVHGIAKYTLQVFPLFSNEEIFTNEEAPDYMVILPDRIYYNETIWENTPPVGIFNVIYTVEFEGVTAQVSKMVIKCPIWLLFIIIFAIIAIIIYFVTKSRTRKKSSRHAETE